MACNVAANVLTSFNFYQGNDKTKGIGFLEIFKRGTYQSEEQAKAMQNNLKQSKRT